MKSLKCNPLRAQLLSALALPLFALAAPFAQAQNFESYYGEQPSNDSGEDVKSVNNCPITGSIVVGTRRHPNGVEVLATRTDDNGVALWQQAYRIAGSDYSTANAVTEVRNDGFAITGAVRRSPTVADTFIYVLRIDCNGRPLWARLLPNQANGNSGVGYDIIEAVPIGTNRPELIAVGDENLRTPVGAVHGRIIRLNSNGGLVFNHAYSRPNQPMGLRFRALTENYAAATRTMEIVVAGSAARGTSWIADRRALIFRTNFAGAPVCNAELGKLDSINEDYFGITALTQGNYFAESALVGATEAPTSAAPSVYLTRFAAFGCVPQAQAFWGDRQGEGATAFDVVESPATSIGFGPSIVATGTIAGAVTAGDGFALTADDAILSPVGGQFRYSTQSGRRETLFAIDNKRDRFVMSGSTFTDWDGSGDAQDFYLVQTDPNKKTQCVREWDYKWERAELPYERFTPPVKVIPQIAEVDVRYYDAKDEGYCCQLDPN
jgi:hypothetical protein